LGDHVCNVGGQAFDTLVKPAPVPGQIYEFLPISMPIVPTVAFDLLDMAMLL
jgi:hypothetical protein